MDQSSNIKEPFFTQNESQIQQKQEQEKENNLPRKINLEQQQQKNTEEYDFKANEKHIFLFINPGSGSRDGHEALQKLMNHTESFEVKQKFSSQQQKNKEFPDTLQAKIHFTDISNLDSRDIAFENIRKFIKIQQEKSKIMSDKQNKNNTNSNELAYCIVCGGDGSIMWMVSLLTEANIEFDNVVIGTIPLGTGNDFSRALGWGPGTDINKMLKNNFKGLRKLIEKWISGTPHMFDIWDIDFEVFDPGCFISIQKDHKGQLIKKPLVDSQDSSKNLTFLTKTMSNYFSFGVDARIGLGFDLNRTTSRCGNNCMYTWEGFKKLFLKTHSVNHVIYSLEEIDEKYIDEEYLSDDIKNDLSQEDNINNSNIDITNNNKDSMQKLQNNNNSNNNGIDSENNNDSELKDQFFTQNNNNDVNNIRNIAKSEDVQKITNLSKNNSSNNNNQIRPYSNSAEVKQQLFKTRTKKTMTEDEILISEQKGNLKGKSSELQRRESKQYLKGEPAIFVIQNINSMYGGSRDIWKHSQDPGIANFDHKEKIRKSVFNKQFQNQNFGDKKLEMFQFQSYGNLILEFLIKGNGQRITQGEGPFALNFRESKKEGELLDYYFQIDGEYYGVKGLKRVVIRHSKKVKNGQIKVLVESKVEEQIIKNQQTQKF